MTTPSPTSKTVFEKLTQPILGLVEQCNHKRKCNALTDHEWIETGLLRMLSQEPSGRAFLQRLSDSGRSDLKRSHFFETLKSKRRLKLCSDVSLSLYETLKRLDIETLRQSAPKGRKVIYVWDRAGIDFLQWFKWKHVGGIYFVSREKKNMDLMIMAELGFDNKDPINAGVQSYQLVGCSAGVTMHRVVYKCPISGDVYCFVTSLSTVPPGLIAYLYKTRWDIEKIFDQVKNKLSEKKAWATSNTAKKMQAQFVCIAHNLMLILEGCLEKEGIGNVIENNRRDKRLEKALAGSRINSEKLPAFLKQPKRATQRSVKFIRWLRNHLYINATWREALGPLKRIYAIF